ncbi:MAG: hypothetical protein KJ718_06225 [Nanoarchaeota archaeon]|nr:hypothetical protein [Nanoarchaeota archaeon]MBU1052117.1 hypothetical protein [Nanoarchaeota archaeon]MBU1987927.1 hypothetical protein [Nanoarchaeota archaeon]
METLNIILSVLLVYFSLTLIIPAIIVPNLWLYKTKKTITSKKLKEKIKELGKIKNKNLFVKSTFLYVAKRYSAATGPINFLVNLPKLFQNDPNKITEKNGFAYCHVQDLIIKTILIGSKRFKEKDIKEKITFSAAIHQHLEVNIDGKKINLDPWAYDLGVPYGKYLTISTSLRNLLHSLTKL